MERFVAEKLPVTIVEGIKAFCDERVSKLKSEIVCFNEVIREDMLPLLDTQCTILYYPTADADNNGFHKTYRYRGENIHFVYINTNQDIEKQIFTAAHELGHILRVDDYLKDHIGIELDFDLSERIMNRFAAELLMPEALFCKFLNIVYKEKEREAGGITVAAIIQIITKVMNEFYVPFKSVVYRMYELDYLDEDSAAILWSGTNTLPKRIIVDYSKKYAKEQGFLRLYNPDKKTHIAGLKERLDLAREKSIAPEQWLNEFYNRFGLEQSDAEESLKEEIQIAKSEETRNNAGESCD